MNRFQLFDTCTTFSIKKSSRIHKISSKVVTDEPSRLGRPAERAGQQKSLCDGHAPGRGRRRVVSCLHAPAPARTGAPRTGVGRVGSGTSQHRPQDCGKRADCSRFAARLRALRPRSSLCWSGGGGARTRDENFLRGAGAGWKFLSSVRHAGKVPQRAPNSLEFHYVYR